MIDTITSIFRGISSDLSTVSDGLSLNGPVAIAIAVGVLVLIVFYSANR